MHPTIAPWIEAGLSNTSKEQHPPIVLSNTIALILALTLFIQLPLMWPYWQQGGQWQWFINLTAIGLCAAVPILNKHHYPAIARWVLLAIFTGYLSITELHLSAAANVHYFYLLGIFISPFLFANSPFRISVIVMLCYGVLTLFFARCPAVLGHAGKDYIQLVAQSNLLNLVIAGSLCAIYTHFTNQQHKGHLKLEQQRSERLLLNILPAVIAKRLKSSAQPVADYFDESTILFADIADFSKISRQQDPVQLVELLNELYSQFDALLARYQLEKIKTVGDEIMAVCGVPERRRQHALQACKCALAMQHCFRRFCRHHQLPNGLRIGINSGEVVAGVIGKSKFSYDLWGESVNLASRMESHGRVNKIQISEPTYKLINHQFFCQPRGKVMIKGMGPKRCYWLMGRHDHNLRATGHQGMLSAG